MLGNDFIANDLLDATTINIINIHVIFTDSDRMFFEVLIQVNLTFWCNIDLGALVSHELRARMRFLKTIATI